MSEREPKRQACDDRMGDMACTLLKGHKGRHIDERVFGEVKPSYADLAARLADAEARAEAAEAERDEWRTRCEAAWLRSDKDLAEILRLRSDLREALRGDQ